VVSENKVSAYRVPAALEGDGVVNRVVVVIFLGATHATALLKGLAARGDTEGPVLVVVMVTVMVILIVGARVVQSKRKESMMDMGLR
jgi:hypothetical protein